MKKLIIGNWKMNPSSVVDAKKVAQKTRRVASVIQHVDVVACPPFVFIPSIVSKKTTPNFNIGAQSVSYELAGSHTGEVSVDMLKSLGVTHVIVGHSEERKRGDTDESISKRVQAVVDAGMYAVLCVGETVRDENGAYLETLKEQIRGSLANIPAHRTKNIILAYEPVWAIGATEAMVPDQIREMTLFVRKVFSDIFNADKALKATVLYGGSVNFRNAADIITIGQVDGLLVGRESVNLPGFSELLKAVDNIF